MTQGIDIHCVEFAVETKTGPSEFRVSWPTDTYNGLVRNPLFMVYKDVDELTEIALFNQPDFLDPNRLHFLLTEFESCASAQGKAWPAMPVLQFRGGEFQFVDGRHRCQALARLGATRIPVLVTR